MSEAAGLATEIQRDLQAQADPGLPARVRERYGMEIDGYLGVRTPAVRKVANDYYKRIRDETVDRRLALCEGLLKEGVYELKVVAFHWASRCKRDYAPHHFRVFEGWLKRYVEDWIDCDDLCTHVLGEFLLRYPESLPEVLEWTSSPNRWVRRASAVALVLPARKGEYLQQVLDTADLLMHDADDLVVKGYGWMLKVASGPHQDEIFGYVMDNKGVMPRVALRYAIEKMPPERKKAAMQKG